MKSKQLILLSILPVLMIIGGLALLDNEDRMPRPEEPTNLRNYISKVQTSETELNEREKEMLSNLSVCASELTTFNEAYSAMKKLVSALSKLLVWIGVLQLLAIVTIYIKSRTQQDGVVNA